MRVVFDSNIFISALVIPGCQAEKAIFKLIDSQDFLILSKPVIDEILSVLARKFGRDREAVSRVAVYLAGLGEIIHPIRGIKILKDDPDNRILECAISGKADMIVAGDKQMLALKEYKGIKIITLKEYLG